MYACRYGNSKLLKILHDLGFTIDKNTIGNLLHLTLYSGTTRIINDFLRRVEVSQSHLTSLLKYSATLNKREMAFFHLVNGAMVKVGEKEDVEYLNIFPKENCLWSSNTNKKIFEKSAGGGSISIPFLEISDEKKKDKSNSYFSLIFEVF